MRNRTDQLLNRRENGEICEHHNRIVSIIPRIEFLITPQGGEMLKTMPKSVFKRLANFRQIVSREALLCIHYRL